MDQHPVPQNISSYEFRLVGDMTLKQFFQLAGGIVAGLIFFRSPLPNIIKWPLIIISVATGILLAFVPINGRPFSQWIMAFIKAVYSPTQYFWATPSSPASADLASVTPPSPPPPAAPVVPSSPPEIFESQLLSHFNKLYDSSSPPPQTPITTQTLYSKLDASAADAPPISPPPIAPQSVSKTNDSPSLSPIFITPPIPQPITAPSRLTPLVRFSPNTTPQTEAKPSPTSSVLTPEHPNLLAGLVIDPTGKSLEGAILEITDSTTNLPVRAMRSNKLGQFQTATPLKAGSYIIIAEKDGFSFDPVTLIVQDKIVPPILIQAKT